MLTFDAVTTYAPQHWESHARRCVESFAEHWRGIELRQFTDAMLIESSVWLADFKIKNAWRATDNYRFDAVRFAHKVAAIELAYHAVNSDVLIWIDADCITHSMVDAEWLSGLLGSAEFGYLKRINKYPECGFVMFRRCVTMDKFINALADAYRSGGLFDMAEWHDSWAIEQIRQQINPRCTSLSGTAENTGHPLVNGPLGSRLDHLKGKRKTAGRSHGSDLKIHRTEKYWSQRG